MTVGWYGCFDKSGRFSTGKFCKILQNFRLLGAVIQPHFSRPMFGFLVPPPKFRPAFLRWSWREAAPRCRRNKPLRGGSCRFWGKYNTVTNGEKQSKGWPLRFIQNERKQWLREMKVRDLYFISKKSKPLQIRNLCRSSSSLATTRNSSPLCLETNFAINHIFDSISIKLSFYSISLKTFTHQPIQG